MEKTKTIVLFDIDYTLFDAQAFGEKVSTPLAKKLGVNDKEEFFRIAKESNDKSKLQHGFYHPKTYLQLLKEVAESKASLEELEEIYYNEEFYKLSLYDDAQFVFHELVKKNIEIGIFSRGHKEFQLLKILSLKKHLLENKVHIFTNKLDKLPEVLQQYKDYTVFLVDDMLLILEAAKKINDSVKTVLIKRKIRERFQITDNFIPDFSINELKDLLPLV